MFSRTSDPALRPVGWLYRRNRTRAGGGSAPRTKQAGGQVPDQRGDLGRPGRRVPAPPLPLGRAGSIMARRRRLRDREETEGPWDEAMPTITSFPRVGPTRIASPCPDAPPGGHFDSMIPETRWAKTVDDAYIAYQDFGDGPVTLCVVLRVDHPSPRCSGSIRPRLDSLARLAERMRVHFDKRGTGMSDRFARAPDLEARMDDIRAVMDAAEVDQAALCLGRRRPPLAAFFAATHPERTVALCIDPHIQLKRTHDYPSNPPKRTSRSGWLKI